MRVVNIRVISERGCESLQTHLREKKSASFKDRFVYNQAFGEKVISCDARVTNLLIWTKHRYISLEGVLPVARDMMIKNGSVENEDFILTIEEVQV